MIQARMLVKVGTRTGLVPSMIEDPILIPARAHTRV